MVSAFLFQDQIGGSLSAPIRNLGSVAWFCISIQLSWRDASRRSTASIHIDLVGAQQVPL